MHATSTLAQRALRRSLRREIHAVSLSTAQQTATSLHRVAVNPWSPAEQPTESVGLHYRSQPPLHRRIRMGTDASGEPSTVPTADVVRHRPDEEHRGRSAHHSQILSHVLLAGQASVVRSMRFALCSRLHSSLHAAVSFDRVRHAPRHSVEFNVPHGQQRSFVRSRAKPSLESVAFVDANR